MHTIASVKEQLPDVKVHHEKTRKDCIGWVRGRKLDFPRVYLPELDAEFTFSWEQIVRSLNNDKPLIA